MMNFIYKAPAVVGIVGAIALLWVSLITWDLLASSQLIAAAVLWLVTFDQICQLLNYILDRE